MFLLLLKPSSTVGKLSTIYGHFEVSKGSVQPFSHVLTVDAKINSAIRYTEQICKKLKRKITTLVKVPAVAFYSFYC